MYTIATDKDVKHMRETGYLPFHSVDIQEANMDAWMMAQMKKRLPSQMFVGPHWCFTSLNQCCVNDDCFVIEFEATNDLVLMFDNNDWIQVANDVMNNMVTTYLAYSKKETFDNRHASQTDIVHSWERMFDVPNPNRDIDFCGPVSLRAVVPFIHSSMVKNLHK